jgi:hypothetical protein
MNKNVEKNIKKWLAALALASILPACVTINIYFPAAAAEKAADKIIDEVWQIKNGQNTPSETPSETPAK